MNYLFSEKIAHLKPSAIREILKYSSDPTVISLAAGNPSADAFPVDAVKKITKEILEENPILALQYSITEGYAPLISTMKNMLKTRYSFDLTDNELVITSGAQQAIELSCKVFCNEGDTLICESPSFIGSLNSFRSYNVNLVGVEMEDDGIDIEKLENALQTNKNVKLIYVIPNFQNPSGKTMSLEKRKAVYQLAVKYNVVILEDNPYGDLRFEGENIPSIKSFDTTGNVIYCGSFSKVLSPGLRVGYVFANKDIMPKITVAKQVSDVHSSILSQLICNKFLTDYNFDEHIVNLQKIYKEKCNVMIEAMQEFFPQSITYQKPKGGLFVWCDLPADFNMLEFCTVAVRDHKVAIVPGSAFLTDESAKSSSFRLNFSTPTNENITKGIEILGGLAKKF